MARFTTGEIARIREARDVDIAFAEVLDTFRHHTRDEMVEAYDAIARCEANGAACDRVNAVLNYQAAGVPLINGKPAGDVERRRAAPMF